MQDLDPAGARVNGYDGMTSPPEPLAVLLGSALDGNYALRLIFNDGHDTGLFSWRFLHELGSQYRVNWERYLQRCAEAGKPRT